MRPQLPVARLAGIVAATACTIALVAARGPSAAVVTWVKYVDPAEHAFTLDVPAGYRVEGGTVRASPIDPRLDVRAASPDGSVSIRIGDPTIPNFSEPNAMTRAQGRREGASFELSGGQRLTLSHYIPGVQFAYEYGRRRMQSVCVKPELKAARPVPNPPHYSYWAATGTTVVSGEAYFLCAAEGMVGWVSATTAETRMQGTSIWTVPGVMSFVARKAQAGSALSTTLHMSYSIVVDENWRAQLLRAQGAYGQQTAATFKAELAADAQQMRRIDEVQRSTFQGMDDIIAGITPTVDPLTGERHDIMTGTGSYYWVDGQGRTVTTKTYVAPGPDAHPLQVLSPDQR